MQNVRKSDKCLVGHSEVVEVGVSRVYGKWERVSGRLDGEGKSGQVKGKDNESL